MSKFTKAVKTEIKGTLLKLFKQIIKDEEIKESEYLRDLIKSDVKKRFNLKDGINAPKVQTPQRSA